MATRDLNLNIHERRDGNALTQAANDLEKLSRGVDATGEKFKSTATDLERLDKQVITSKAHIKDLQTQFARTGDTSLFGDIRKEENNLRNLEKVIKGLTPEVAKVSASVGPEVAKGFDNPGFKSMAIGGLVAVAAAAAPALGAIISGAVAGTVSGGGIAGGVIAATADSRVRLAFKDLTSQFTAEAFGGGAFVGPVVAGIGILKDEFKSLHIDEALAKGASSVPILAQGIGDLVHNLMPGFNHVMDQAENFTTVFAGGLAETGTAISDFLDSIMSSEGTIEGLAYGFKLLAGTIIATGNVLQFLGDLFHDNVVAAAKFTGVMEDVVRGLENVARATTQVLTFGLVNLDNNHGFSNTFAWMNDAMEETGAEGFKAADAVSAVGAVLRDSADATDAQTAALKKVNDEFERMINLEASLMTDNIDFQQGLQDLADQLDKNGNELNTTTDAGRANERAFIALAKLIRQTRDDQIALGTSTQDANATLEANKEALYKQAEAAGISREEIEKLIGSLLRVPVLYGDIAAARTYSQGTSGGEGRRAAGGPVTAGVSYLVGENRPEVFTPSINGYISPSVSSWAAGMGGSGWGGGSQFELVISSGGSAMDDLLVQLLSRAVQVRGGDGAVLGIRTVTG